MPRQQTNFTAGSAKSQGANVRSFFQTKNPVPRCWKIPKWNHSKDNACAQKRGPERVTPLRPLRIEDRMKKKSISCKYDDNEISLRKFARNRYKTIKLYSTAFSAANSSIASCTAHFFALAVPK